MLQPLGAPAPLEGDALNDFVQTWLVGVIGTLDGTMVRPYDQSEPPVIPDAGVAWMAFRVTIDQSDTFPQITIEGDGLSSRLARHETLKVLCSFYDLGVGGLAQRNASLLRDSALFNLDYFYGTGYALVAFEDPVTVPTILKERWQYRVDMPFSLRRAVERIYSVPSILSAEGTIHNDVGAPDVKIKVIQ